MASESPAVASPAETLAAELAARGVPVGDVLGAARIMLDGMDPQEAQLVVIAWIGTMTGAA